MDFLNIDTSMKIQDFFSKEQAGYKENEIIPELEVKNPYLKKDDVPKIEIISDNHMIYEGKNYRIDEYLDKIIGNSSNFLDDYIYYEHCKICKKNMNKYFCRDCNINLCEKCFNDFNCLKNKHTSWYLDDVKKTCDDNIKEIKTILNKNIIYIKDGDKIIKKIKKYIDKYINNNNIENDSNLIKE